MFTGIIEGLGTITGANAAGAGRRVRVETDFVLDGTRIGDSVAVNGACLTVVAMASRRFEVDLSPESVSTTTLGRASPGQRVNIERALRLGDRLDGHWVTGHVDGVGTLVHKKSLSNAVVLTFSAPRALFRYLVQKGSVAVDGVSLTVNGCTRDHFTVSVIPHTARVTTLAFRGPGDAVNIETDILGKYVECFLKAGESRGISSVDRELLARTGFLK